MAELLDQYVLKIEVSVEEILREDCYDSRFKFFWAMDNELIERDFWVTMLKAIDEFHLGVPGSRKKMRTIRSVPMSESWKAYLDYGAQLAPELPYRKLDRDDIVAVGRNFELGKKSPDLR